MIYLLDTNVLSEIRKPPTRADAHVLSWFAGCGAEDLALSAITVLEIQLGATRLARRDPDQARRLEAWLEDDVLGVFSDRILPVGVAAARAAARLHVPDPRPERDALIAATAIVHGLTVATRNVADFGPMGVPVVDPWAG